MLVLFASGTCTIKIQYPCTLNNTRILARIENTICNESTCRSPLCPDAEASTLGQARWRALIAFLLFGPKELLRCMARQKSNRPPKYQIYHQSTRFLFMSSRHARGCVIEPAPSHVQSAACHFDGGATVEPGVAGACQPDGGPHAGCIDTRNVALQLIRAPPKFSRFRSAQKELQGATPHFK